MAARRLTICAGSPPRLWGALFDFKIEAPDWRFTPTPVGSAARSSAPACSTAVHPHACGERLLEASVKPVTPVHPHACGERRLR